MKYTLLFCSILILLRGLSLAQSNHYHLPDNTIFEQLNSSVQSIAGSEYEINYYYILDSLFRKPFYINEFSDPSGKLSNAVLFIASKKRSVFVNGVSGEEILRRDSAFIGIFKNGRFAGISDFIDMSYASTLLNINQLNNDNEIDISIKCNNPDRQSEPNYLWIISWNGSDCRIINDYDPLTKRSKLISSDYFYFIDQDSDLIFEINSCWEDIDSIDNPFSNIDIATIPKMITYGWDGSLYSYFHDIPQYKYGQFLPRDGLETNVNCLVEETDTIFIIKYTLTNSLASKQKISNFYIDSIAENSRITAPDHWETLRFNYSGYSWVTMNVGSIKPGKSLSEFKLVGKGLPSLIYYYIQGDVAIVSCCGECPEEPITPTYEMRINNVKTNSVRGLTIGIKDLLYFEKDHIDTLKSFINQCGKLGWIKSQQVIQKYLDYLTTSKTAIQQNDIQTAKTNLNKILADAADSAAEITHEAYALIRYNTEYIIENISTISKGIFNK